MLAQLALRAARQQQQLAPANAAAAVRAALGFRGPLPRGESAVLSQQLQRHRGKGTSARGELPKGGPSAQHLLALPFECTRVQAAAAFQRFHSRHWIQNTLLRGAQPAKESYVPFWVGEATVAVNVKRAEVGESAALLGREACMRIWPS